MSDECRYLATCYLDIGDADTPEDALATAIDVARGGDGWHVVRLSESADAKVANDPIYGNIYQRLLAFYSPLDAMAWLLLPHPQFAVLGEDRATRPAARIARGDADSVLAIIDQLESGANA